MLEGDQDREDINITNSIMLPLITENSMENTESEPAEIPNSAAKLLKLK